MSFREAVTTVDAATAAGVLEACAVAGVAVNSFDFCVVEVPVVVEDEGNEVECGERKEGRMA